METVEKTLYECFVCFYFNLLLKRLYLFVIHYYRYCISYTNIYSYTYTSQISSNRERFLNLTLSFWITSGWFFTKWVEVRLIKALGKYAYKNPVQSSFTLRKMQFKWSCYKQIIQILNECVKCTVVAELRVAGSSSQS